MAEKKNEIITLEEQIQELDPYAPDYPIQLLKNGLKINSKQAETALEKVSARSIFLSRDRLFGRIV